MQKMLEELPEYRHELLYDTRTGNDRRRYSAAGYTTWLCRFDTWRPQVTPIVEWLLRCGVRRNVWIDIALRDRSAFDARLRDDPALAEVRHALRGTRIIEFVPSEWQQPLIEAGTDITDIFSAILVGDLNRARNMITRTPDTLTEAKDDGLSVLDYAIVRRQDDLACWLIERGAPIPRGTARKLGPLVLACCWGCINTLQTIATSGAVLTRKVAQRSLLDYAVNASVPSVDVVRFLTEQVRPDVAEVQQLWQTATDLGEAEIAQILSQYA